MVLEAFERQQSRDHEIRSRIDQLVDDGYLPDVWQETIYLRPRDHHAILMNLLNVRPELIQQAYDAEQYGKDDILATQDAVGSFRRGIRPSDETVETTKRFMAIAAAYEKFSAVVNDHGELVIDVYQGNKRIQVCLAISGVAQMEMWEDGDSKDFYNLIDPDWAMELMRRWGEDS